MLAISAISVLAAFSVWLITYRIAARHMFDACALSLYIFALFQFTRAALMSLGIDTPFPDYLFGEYWHLIAWAQILGVLWLISFAAGYLTLQRISDKITWVFPYVRPKPNPRSVMLLNAAITIGAATVAIWLLSRFGSFGLVQHAVKAEKQLAGLYAFRQFASIGAFSSAAALVYFLFGGGRQHPQFNRLYLPLTIIFLLTNLTCGYLWAARGPTVFTLGFLFLSFHIYRNKGIMSLVGGVVLLFGAVFSLRIMRDIMITGEILGTISDSHPIRAITLASNMQEFDALMLLLRDWSDFLKLRWGEDFYNGIVGVIPRMIWPEKPEVIAPGRWFRLFYQPSIINGWPFTVVGEWFINFWYAGVAVGGALSAVVLRAVQTRYRDFRSNPYSLCLTVIYGVSVFGSGIETRWAGSYILWSIPWFGIALFLNATTARSVDKGVTQNVVGMPKARPQIRLS